jgi:hypothetical protein
MSDTPLTDHGQKLAPPAGKVIGFVDTKVNFEAFTQSLHRAGFPASTITSIHGADGLHLLEGLKHRRFFFSGRRWHRSDEHRRIEERALCGGC